MVVHGERSRIATFPRYRTYTWASGVTPARTPSETTPALLDRRIHDGIDRGLAAKGYVRTEGSATLLVDYDVVTEASDSAGFHAFFAARQHADRAEGMPAAQGFQAGTLVMHLVDERTHEVAYRAWATHVVGEAVKLQQVDDAVQRMLADLPRVMDTTAGR